MSPGKGLLSSSFGQARKGTCRQGKSADAVKDFICFYMFFNILNMTRSVGLDMTTNMGLNTGLIWTELRKSGKRQNWKNGVVEVGEKKWSLEAKNGLREFFVGWKLMFWSRTLIWRGQKNEIIAKNDRKWPKIFFEKFLVEVGNLSNLANWIKNPCFLYGFL